MEPVKITRIGEIEGEELSIYQTLVTADVKEAFKSIDRLMTLPENSLPQWFFGIHFFPDPKSFIPNGVHNLGDFFACYYLPEIFPVKGSSEDENLNEWFQAARHLLEKEFLNLRCLWWYSDGLFWSSRPYKNQKDHNFISLKVEEYALEQRDEYSRLQQKVERLRQISCRSVKGSRAKIPDDIVAFVLTRDAEKCVACSSKEELQIDHVVPVSRGGSDSVENLQLLCRTCNQKRGNLGNQ